MKRGATPTAWYAFSINAKDSRAWNRYLGSPDGEALTRGLGRAAKACGGALTIVAEYAPEDPAAAVAWAKALRRKTKAKP